MLHMGVGTGLSITTKLDVNSYVSSLLLPVLSEQTNSLQFKY